jgi:hypothetical protein
MKSNQKAEAKQKLLKSTFGQFREMWDGEHGDDRGLISGCYDQMMEAAEAMKKVNNNFVWVAFNRKFAEEWNMMAEIVERFTTEQIYHMEIF